MRVKKIIIISFVLLLSGCSTKFVYKNIDWLVYWYVDDFVELTDDQEAMFDLKLATWLGWHKQNEIPKYIAHLDELSLDIASQQISLAKIDYHQQKAAEHWLRLKTRIIPDLVAMAPSLSQEQVTSIFKEIDKLNEEEAEDREERLAETPEKRKKNALKRNNRNLKRWLGKLTPEQESLIQDMYGNYHSNGDLWRQYRVKYQAELKSLLKAEDRSEVFKSSLKTMLMTPEVYRSEELNRRNLENAGTYKRFLLSVDMLTTEKQRNHLLEEINELADDFNDLVK
jgi:uncharacterized protein YeaO (DUF488 family)